MGRGAGRVSSRSSSSGAMTSSGDREKNLAEGKNSHTSGKQVMEKKASTLKENQKKKQPKKQKTDTPKTFCSYFQLIQ